MVGERTQSERLLLGERNLVSGCERWVHAERERITYASTIYKVTFKIYLFVSQHWFTCDSKMLRWSLGKRRFFKAKIDHTCQTFHQSKKDKNYSIHNEFITYSRPSEFFFYFVIKKTCPFLFTLFLKWPFYFGVRSGNEDDFNLHVEQKMNGCKVPYELNMSVGWTLNERWAQTERSEELKTLNDERMMTER